MSTFMIGAVCYVAGMCFVLALLLYFASNKRKKEALDQEQHSLCIHCKKMVPTHTLNHWEECENHPARLLVESIRRELGISFITPITMLPSRVMVMKENLREMALYAYAGEEISIGRLAEVLHMHVFDARELVAGLQESELDCARKEIERLRVEFIHLLSVFLTVREVNQPEWMEAIVEDVNRACVALGDTDRFWTFGGHIVRINKPAIDLAKNGADMTVIAEVQS